MPTPGIEVLPAYRALLENASADIPTEQVSELIRAAQNLPKDARTMLSKHIEEWITRNVNHRLTAMRLRELQRTSLSLSTVEKTADAVTPWIDSGVELSKTAADHVVKGATMTASGASILAEHVDAKVREGLNSPDRRVRLATWTGLSLLGYGIVRAAQRVWHYFVPGGEQVPVLDGNGGVLRYDRVYKDWNGNVIRSEPVPGWFQKLAIPFVAIAGFFALSTAKAAAEPYVQQARDYLGSSTPQPSPSAVQPSTPPQSNESEILRKDAQENRLTFDDSRLNNKDLLSVGGPVIVDGVKLQAEDRGGKKLLKFGDTVYAVSSTLGPLNVMNIVKLNGEVQAGGSWMGLPPGKVYMDDSEIISLVRQMKEKQGQSTFQVNVKARTVPLQQATSNPSAVYTLYFERK